MDSKTSLICLIDFQLCTSRAQNRSGHPTLPPGSRVRNAVGQMQRIFVKPTLSEGWKTIVTVRSFEAAGDLVRRLSPPISLLKFPRTPHLLDLGAATDDDLVQRREEQSATTGQTVVITEKIDGANMGLSLSASRQIVIQNRSHYVNSSSHDQFKRLDLWIQKHLEHLYKVLDRDEFFPERYILYGEWLAATHSIPYTHLPDYFVAFDIYDRATRGWADRQTVESLLKDTDIHLVPCIYEGSMPDDDELKKMVQMKSLFYDGPVEGIYVKIESRGKVLSRGKVVRNDFIAGNDHWTKGRIAWNGIVTTV
jgi:atypical dual specificity phosphatase